METIEKSIEINVPVKSAYNQWTQFEEFPRFMEGVEQVRQLDDTHLHWVANVGGKKLDWNATITDQVPDKRIAWRADDRMQSGIVTFDPLDQNRTVVRLRIDYEPEGIVEETGDKLGFVSRRVEGDLKRFKEFIESRGRETGGWRGTV
jgi:uncharacterized membrane protein